MISYEEWLAEGNGAREDETLEEAVSRTVDSMYDWMDTDSSDNED